MSNTELLLKEIEGLSPDYMNEILAPIAETPLQIIDFISQPIYREAARLKSAYRHPDESITKSPLSLADPIGLATALDRSGIFVTADGGFLVPEAQEHAPISWFRPPKK